MNKEERIKEYESKSGKKAIVDGQETIGFKRWKQQHKSDSDLEEIIPKFEDDFKKDVKDIIEIYLKKTDISPSTDILKYLKRYILSVFPTKVIYKGKSFEISSNKLSLRDLGIKDLQNVKGLFKLHTLEYLNLSYNALESLPEKINNLINLRELILDFNNLSTIPKEIGDLTNLKVLSMRIDDITIPMWVNNLSNLEEIFLDKDSIFKNDIPTSLLDNKDIKVYF